MLCVSYKISYKLPIIITRGNNVYGPRQYPEKLIPKFIHLAMAGRKFTVHGTGEAQRSYMYCEDVADAFCAVLHKGKVCGISLSNTPPPLPSPPSPSPYYFPTQLI